MPSYRVTLVVGALQPGVQPTAVLPAARDAAAELTTVEAFDVQVVAGQARIVVRFSADEYEIADQVGKHVASVVSHLAAVETFRITERQGSRWS